MLFTKIKPFFLKNIDIELENWRSLKSNSEKMILELSDRKNKLLLELSDNQKNPEDSSIDEIHTKLKARSIREGNNISTINMVSTDEERLGRK